MHTATKTGALTVVDGVLTVQSGVYTVSDGSTQSAGGVEDCNGNPDDGSFFKSVSRWGPPGPPPPNPNPYELDYTLPGGTTKVVVTCDIKITS